MLPIDELVKHPCLHPLGARAVLPEVLRIIAEYSVTPEELMGKTRARRVTEARHEVWAYLHDKRHLSVVTIGALWGVTQGAVSKALRWRNGL